MSIWSDIPPGVILLNVFLLIVMLLNVFLLSVILLIVFISAECNAAKFILLNVLLYVVIQTSIILTEC